ncbi:hypothetical protein [Candidatus Oscillochloris fontis]|uniref:hypothetical protein n=1 Tax=Candidatus Oscillochloris fontis TaxID=2496868 RepID=UPI00101BE872|nr:hypothetical protein [Candidatus Oscillochloris fontis]
MALFLQLLIAGVWATTLVIQTRRLFRLACVAQLRQWEEARLRRGWNRIWWWLGQDAFWQGVRLDTIKALELSLMIFLISLGVME